MNIKSADDCITGDMRLVGGETEAEGRVEICINRRWGTMCDNEWTEKHTAVVCRHLGFSGVIGGNGAFHERIQLILCNLFLFTITSASAYYTSERFGEGTGPIFMDYINCTGSEFRIYRKCSYFTHYYGCSHNDDVGVQCQPGL